MNPGSSFPRHVSLGWIDPRVERRAYADTSWITAGGTTAMAAFGKIARYATARRFEPPLPTLVKLDAERGVGASPDYPVRVFCFLGSTTSLADDPVEGVRVVRPGALFAFALPFEHDFATDDDVKIWTRELRRVLRERGVRVSDHRDAYFAAYDSSTREKFRRRNEVLIFIESL